MKKIIVSLSIAAAFLTVMGMTAQTNFAEEGTMPISESKKILIVYFSHTGNTREIAEQIHKIVGGDIFEIQAAKPYLGDYNAVVKQAKQELDSGYKPELKTKIEDIKPYDLVFIGYPIWFGTFPAPVNTFLSEYDLSGKAIVPFCTHGGGGPGHNVADIAKLCPKSTVFDSFVILGSNAKNSQKEVSEWLRKIGITK